MNSIIKQIWYGMAYAVLCLFSFSIVSCTKDDYKVELTPVQLANKFVLDYGELYYLWNDKVDYNKSYKSYTDPFELFNSVIYSDLDE